MDDFLEFAGAMGSIMLIAGGFIAVLFGLAFWADSASCSATASAMKVPHSYSVATGCMITVGGKTIPLWSYRVVNGAGGSHD